MGVPALSLRQRLAAKKYLRNKRKSQERRLIEWETKNFHKQNAFINSEAKRILAQCTRRAGKSYGVGLKMIKTAWENPGVNVLYIALTRSSAKNILYEDVLLEILKKKKISFKQNSTELSFKLSNGSTIRLAGADNSGKEMHKLLGQKYALVAIDEAAFFKQNLEHLCEEIIDPALADLDGQLMMISTPSDNVFSYYHDCATEKIKGWEIHKWTAFDNPMMTTWGKRIQDKIDRNPDVVHTPAFRRMYKNEWVIDKGLQVYKFLDSCLIPELPALPEIKGVQWKYGLGIDLGWDDETAFTVSAWHRYSNTFYIVFKFKKSKMDFIDVAEYIKKLEGYYEKFEFQVIDGANKQGVQTMVNRFGLPLVAAEKQGKKDHIELFNSEMRIGQIKVVTDIEFDQGSYTMGNETNDPLINEWANLVWNEEKKEKGVYEELSSCPNHLSDSTLYNWYHAYNYTSIAIPEKPIEHDSEEYLLRQLEREEKQMEKTEDDFNNDDDLFIEQEYSMEYH